MPEPLGPIERLVRRSQRRGLPLSVGFSGPTESRRRARVIDQRRAAEGPRRPR